MNKRLIFLSAIITAIVGSIIGISAVHISNNKYQSEFYQNIEAKFFIIGGVAGFIIGAGQESLRQLKAQQDLEEENQ